MARENPYHQVDIITGAAFQDLWVDPVRDDGQKRVQGEHLHLLVRERGSDLREMPVKDPTRRHRAAQIREPDLAHLVGFDFDFFDLQSVFLLWLAGSFRCF